MSKSNNNLKISSTQISSISTISEAICNALLLTTVGTLLGALIILLITDHTLLYTKNTITNDAYLRAENTYLILWTSPIIIKAILHLNLLIPILTLAIKLARYTEAALYFDGPCLGIMLLILGLYTGSSIPNIRKLAASTSNKSFIELIQNFNNNKLINQNQFNLSSPIWYFINKILIFLSYPTNILLNSTKAIEREEEFKKSLESNPINDKIRNELLSVTAAGHSIAIFLLIGIILLQIGKVYAEVEDAKLKAKFEIQESLSVSNDKKHQ